MGETEQGTVGLGDKVKKYAGYGLIVGGIALAGYAIYKRMKSKKGTAGLAGISRDSKGRFLSRGKKKGGKKKNGKKQKDLLCLR